MGLLGNVNVKVHFGVVVVTALAGGVAVLIFCPPGTLAEYKEFALWAIALLGGKRLIDAKNGGK